MWQHFPHQANPILRTFFSDLFGAPPPSPPNSSAIALQVVILLHTVQYIGLGRAIWISEMRSPGSIPVETVQQIIQAECFILYVLLAKPATARRLALKFQASRGAKPARRPQARVILLSLIREKSPILSLYKTETASTSY